MKTFLCVVLIGISLLASGDASAVAQTQPTEQTTSQKQAVETTDRAEDTEISREITDYTFWLAVFTCALVGVTVFLGGIAYLQWKDTRITQRAYLSVVPLGIDPLGQKSVAHLSVQNVGKLPARNVSWFIDYKANQNGNFDGLTIDPKKFYPEKGTLVIHPGAEMKRSKDCSLTPEELNDFTDRTERRRFLYVWGELRYLDGFGNQRYTRFCHRYDSRGYEIAPVKYPGHNCIITAESSRYHQFGNDAD